MDGRIYRRGVHGRPPDFLRGDALPGIISEASRRLPAEMRERHPELPWRAIMDVGNVYRHEYDNVAEDAVWRTVQYGLAPLLAFVEDEIALLR